MAATTTSRTPAPEPLASWPFYFRPLRGCTLTASDGEIGKVREFYFDDEHWKARYLIVNTGSWLLEREVLLPPHAVTGIDTQGRTLAVDLTRKQVAGSPTADTQRPISRQDEDNLYRHYGWHPYWMVAGGAMLPVSTLPPPPLEPARKSADEADGKDKGDPHLRSSAELISGYSLHSQDGEIGRVTDFILDEETWEVLYLVVRTGVWFLGKDVLLSPRWIEKISYEGAEVFVNQPRSSIRDAPAYDSSAPLSRAFEQRLHDHYGRKGYWDAVKSGSGA